MSSQSSIETCHDCDANATVTPDPYGNGSPFEFKAQCLANSHHSYIRSYAHSAPAPLYVIDTPREPRQRKTLQPRPPRPPLTPAHASLLALLKG